MNDMEFHEALDMMVKSSEKATEAFEILASPWPPDKRRLILASALFDQANAGIRDFLEATKNIDEARVPYLRSAKKKCRKALKRHRLVLKKIRPYVV